MGCIKWKESPTLKDIISKISEQCHFRKYVWHIACACFIHVKARFIHVKGRAKVCRGQQSQVVKNTQVLLQTIIASSFIENYLKEI